MLNKLIVVCGYDNAKIHSFVKDRKTEYDWSIYFPESLGHAETVKTHLNKTFSNEKILSNCYNFFICTHSEVVTAYIRYLVVSDVIDCNKVEFWFIDEDKETRVTCNSNGNFSDWLPEMCSSLLIEEEIVKLSMKKRVK